MYHVMSGGDQREDIFLDDVDQHDFARTLAEACEKTVLTEDLARLQWTENDLAAHQKGHPIKLGFGSRRSFRRRISSAEPEMGAAQGDSAARKKSVEGLVTLKPSARSRPLLGSTELDRRVQLRKGRATLVDA